MVEIAGAALSMTRRWATPPLLSCQGLGSGLSLHRAQIWLRVSGAPV